MAQIINLIHYGEHTIKHVSDADIDRLLKMMNEAVQSGRAMVWRCETNEFSRHNYHTLVVAPSLPIYVKVEQNPE